MSTPPDKIDLEFQEAALSVAKKIADDEILKGHLLLPKDLLIQRYQKEFQENFATIRKELQHGAVVLAASIEELKKEASDYFSDEVLSGIKQIAALSERIAKEEGKFVAQIEGGGTLQEFANVDDTVMDTLYLGAKRLFDLGLYGDAADAFKFLISINPKKYIFWHGLAHSEYQRARYSQAVDAFKIVCEANSKDFASQVAASRCYAALGQSDKALYILEQTLLAGENEPQFGFWGDILREEILRVKMKQ